MLPKQKSFDVIEQNADKKRGGTVLEPLIGRERPGKFRLSSVPQFW
jgi:hypothetical protein